MRIIYVDEAGTSSHERLVAVAGVIVHGDTEWHPAQKGLNRLFTLVPRSVLQNGFTYHTTELLGHRYDGMWRFQDRLQFIHAVMGTPKWLNLPLIVGLCMKASLSETAASDLGLTIDQMAQVVAFEQCINTISLFMRTHYGPRELGMVIAEDVPDMRTSLQRSLRLLKNRVRSLTPLQAMDWNTDLTPYPVPFGGVGQIVGPINFAPKDEDALLWVADACAFGLKRFFARMKYGDEWALSLLGPDFDLERLLKAMPLGAGSAIFFGDVGPRKPNVTYSVSP